MTTLNLWVENQPEGQGFDATADYLRAARFAPAAGVSLNARTLAGDDAEAVFADFRRLRDAVAAAGHGDDCDDLAPPSLTACPVELIADGYTCAAESLARHTSGEAATFAAWVAGVPSMS